MKKILIHLTLLLSFLCCNTVAAKELNVIVSIAPLHSLVSSLMEGAGEPTLLFEKGIDKTTTLDSFQKSHVITADMMVRVGPGLESSLEQTLNDLPVQRKKVLTLSQFLPLLPRSGTNDSYNISRQQTRDLNFWTDPRLAVMAVRMITPKLVRLDPENQELYLDNEITLIKKLKSLEAEIRAELTPYTNSSGIPLVNSDSYFSHRFLASTEKSKDEEYSFRKVSNTNKTVCTGNYIQSKKLSVGPALYFDAMRLKVRSIKACIKNNNDSSIQSI